MRADTNATSTLPVEWTSLVRTGSQILWMPRSRRHSLVDVVVTLELSNDGLARLSAEAERRQTSVDAVIEEWAASLPTKNRPVKHQRLSFVAMGSSSSSRRASDADDVLAESFGSGLSH